ncbi:hypothetical protein NTGBS_180075 [Candidatus Nitrotoga sp. BS]|nr:hypothetical protein NTGBS_180075 [Candidatus Nitrotoga sp. BS]
MADIDAARARAHIRDAKGNKARFVVTIQPCSLYIYVSLITKTIVIIIMLE